MKLKNLTREEREKAIETVKKQIRDLMRDEPDISINKLVSITRFSEYIVKRIYMKFRREHSIKSSTGRKLDGQSDKIVMS